MRLSLSLPLLIAALSLAACGGDTYELKEPYGPPQELRMDTEAGPLIAAISPWQKAKAGQSTEALLASNRKRPVSGEKITDIAKAPVKTKLDDNVWMIARVFKKKKGQLRASTLYACDYRKKGEFVRFIDISGPANELGSKASKTVRNEISDTVENTCSSRPSRARDAAITEAIRTQPGKGTGRKKVSRILYATGSSRKGDFIGIDDDIYVLFKDKSAYRNPYVSIDDMHIERSRDLEPGRWSKWRKRGKSYELQRVNKDGKKEWRKIKGSIYTLKRQKKNKRADGKFQFVSTTGSMTFGSSSSWYYWTFDKKGNYSSSTSSFGGSGTMAFLDGSMPSYVHASSCSKDGGSSTFSSMSAALVYGKTSPKKGCGDGKAGTYRVDGYTIELAANDGTVVRRPFYMRGKDKVIIGSRGYWRQKDED